MTKRVSDCRMIWRDNNCGAQQLVKLKLIVGLGDHDEVVLTILQPTED